MANWQNSFGKALKWGSYLAAHTFVTAILVGAIWLIQSLLVAQGDPKLFDWIPLRYIFDAMDLGILAAFLIFGTLEAISVFKERDDE